MHSTPRPAAPAPVLARDARSMHLASPPASHHFPAQVPGTLPTAENKAEILFPSFKLSLITHQPCDAADSRVRFVKSQSLFMVASHSHAALLTTAPGAGPPIRPTLPGGSFLISVLFDLHAFTISLIPNRVGILSYFKVFAALYYITNG